MYKRQVIGIFEDHYLKKKPLPVVRPGSQSRRFTHINDTIEICFKAWKQNKNRIPRACQPRYF